MSEIPMPPPPGPRDAAPTFSEVLPFGSRKISMWQSTALLPLLLIAVTAVVLFNLPKKSAADFKAYMNVVAGATLLFSFLLLYIYSGERKRIYWYVIPAAVTIVQLDAFLDPYIYVFRKLLPGDLEGDGFLTNFVGMFFGAGLMEETLKGVPVLFGLAVALWFRRTGSPGGVFTRGIAVQGPIDGLLMGAASGAGFIMIETMTIYVPSTIKAGSATNLDHGLLMGLTLMIPRVIKGVIGHMAYAGIFGYFIGLAATHTRHVFRLVAIGLLTASTLHAFWNSAGDLHPTYGPYLSATLIVFAFFACLLKARQLEASRLGGYIDGRSIVALSPGYGQSPALGGGLVPPAAGGAAGVFTGAAEMASDVPDSGLAIRCGDLRYALGPGRPIDLSALFPSATIPPGCRGAISAGSDGSLSITNTGTATWAVFGPDGAVRTLAPGESFVALPGTRLVLGETTLGIESY